LIGLKKLNELLKNTSNPLKVIDQLAVLISNQVFLFNKVLYNHAFMKIGEKTAEMFKLLHAKHKLSEEAYRYLINIVWFTLERQDLHDLSTILGTIIGLKDILVYCPQLINELNQTHVDLLCNM